MAVVLTFLALAVMWERNWIPFPDFLLDPVIVGAAFFVLLVAVFLWKYRGKRPRQTIQDYLDQDKQSQLTDKEAYELLRYELIQNRLIRIGEMHQRGAEIVGPENQDDNARLYKMTFDRVNVSEKVGVVLDLEQDFDVDPYDTTSLRKAAPEIQNIKVIRGKKVDNFDEEMEDAVSSLGQNVDQKMTDRWIRTNEDGEKVVREQETPISTLGLKQRLNDSLGDEEVEK